MVEGRFFAIYTHIQNTEFRLGFLLLKPTLFSFVTRKLSVLVATLATAQIELSFSWGCVMVVVVDDEGDA